LFLSGYAGFECHLSHLFNTSVLHLEYRLVPEHPLPAAVDDALALYRALLRDGISSSRIIIMGDSAGGGLTLLTVQDLLARHLPIPRAVVTMSPWADFSSSGQSYTRNRLTDVMIRFESLSWGIELVLGPDHTRKARDDPLHSPLFGSFKGFPPMYITVGTAELLEDDSRQVADKAQKAGVDVTLEEGLHLMHVHPIFFSYYPEARKTLDSIRQWVETVFQRETTGY
jgi:monoterpene epsilon-lactone hydrolase